MNIDVHFLLTAAVSAQSSTSYEWGRLRYFDNGRTMLAIVVLVLVVILVWVTYLYRRDTIELKRPVRVLLLMLRCVALLALLFFFFGLERRNRSQIVYNSQVVVLIDDSQSMGLSDRGADAADFDVARLDRVKKALADSPLLDRLRQNHDVSIVRFADKTQRVAFLPKTSREETTDEGEGKGESTDLDSTASEWAKITPMGKETRLGEALVEQLREFQNGPLAAILVFSDGVHNTGVDPQAGVAIAKERGVPIFTVGLGATTPQRNIAVSDFVVPARSFPGDTVNVVGYVQARGYFGQRVQVELYSRRADEPPAAANRLNSSEVRLTAGAGVVSVPFEVEPEEVGRFTYELRIVPPNDDSNPRDNSAQADIEIADRRTHVLLLSGGPSRDYRFLRNQLYRDRTMQVDVLLQSAGRGISQEADAILTDFPDTTEGLYEYDCLVACDPDWTRLDAAQVALIESWIADEAGGMIATAGPVYTAKWTRSAEQAKLKSVYPVEFQPRLTLLDDGYRGGNIPWPLEFEPAGRAAPFLWLGNSAQESEQAWEAFPGVFSYYAVKGAKPGATVYARFSDPAAGIGRERPIYVAGQFYGAGQVFFIGSGELWRLRAVDPGHFETLTTKLIRHVSQGRLLRGSTHGALLVERDRYQVGEVVVLRARLTDSQHIPLSVPSVVAQVIGPDETAQSVQLVADELQPGIVVGQFTADQEGSYHVSLSIPGTDSEVLARQIYVRMPDLERGDLERNETLLATLAEQTGGRYYADLREATESDTGKPSLVDQIASREEVRPFEDAPDVNFTRRQMHWILAVVCGALFVEWGLRRWFHLA